MNTRLYDALKQLREDIPQLAQILKLGTEADVGFWRDMVDAKLLSRLAPDFPAVAAICGGGSSGKSTLFNSLVGQHFSPTGGTAGLNRRVLFSIPAQLAGQRELLIELARPFKEVPEPLQDKAELTQPGIPLYVAHHGALKNMVIVDTPDFDTGAKGAYTNREVTRMALEASDILIYIFTNSNYNNRDNTDFIAQMLTGIGRRKCFLVYRVYPSYSKQEVLEHARTVAEGIYGKSADEFLLGVYRTDEDNRVAAGERFMEIEPLAANEPEFMATLQSIDAAGIRVELFSSVLKDVVQRAEAIRDRAQVARDELRLYLDALQTAQGQAVREALKNFPINRLMRRFARIWADTDPAHVKIMRRTGSVIEFPLKMLLGAAGWARDQMTLEKPAAAAGHEYAEKVDEDLVTAVTAIHNQAVSPQLTVSSSAQDPLIRRMVEAVDTIRARKSLAAGKTPRTESSGDGLDLSIRVDAQPAVQAEQQQLRSRDFKSLLQSILAEKETILKISRDMETDLKLMADDFRKNMGLWRKVNQTFWAFLNVVPATVAVTYVLSTGDPVGGAGLKVKLAGLFGVKDLYALFAIPFTTGLKKADRQQIEEMLQVILQSWLENKSKIVQDLFEKYITGEIIRCAERQIADAERLIVNIDNALQTCKRGDETR